jgi:hypothetical protein
MADKPQPDGNELSTNHARHSQNVMFEDGHVECLTSSVMHDGDNIFLSSRGRSEAGVGRDDAVIGCSEATPTGTRDFGYPKAIVQLDLQGQPFLYRAGQAAYLQPDPAEKRRPYSIASISIASPNATPSEFTASPY